MHFQLHCSRRRGAWTLGQDLLDGVVVPLSIVVVQVGLLGSVVQGDMLPQDVRFTGTELTFMLLTELAEAHLDAVGALTNLADHLSGCEPGVGAVSAHWPGFSTHTGLPTLNLCVVDFRAVLGGTACSFLNCYKICHAIVSCRAKRSLASIAMPSPDKGSPGRRGSLPKRIW